MKRCFTWIVLLVCLSITRLAAQSFTMTADTVTLNLVGSPGATGLVLLNDNVATVSGSVTLHWHVIYSDFPLTWDTAAGICDNNLCYGVTQLWPSGNYKTSNPYTTAGIKEFHLQINQGQIHGGGCHYTTVQLTNEGAIPADSTTVTFKVCRDATGVNDVNNIFSSVKVYPNPANNEANLSFALIETADVAVGVYDIAGRLVFVQPVAKMNTGNKSIAIPVGNMTPGIYTAVLTAGDSKLSQKFTVIK